ncbi:VOC family protein [Rhodococcus erythropolis]|uniref:VOC family protein n=1 Tax=Rhodococcus erythropolis TaxID=1833 RepID=UPI001BEA578E|nr:VOC family protein [Rhodococcus erythropolis]MBT2265715.1 VOC family protein [Rhodococcus erythropolis]
MRLPNQFLIYVSDAASAAAFYGELFDATPEVLSPRYMTFDLGGGVVLALWSGKSRDLDPTTPRNFEVGILVDGGSSEIRAIHDEWVAKGVEVVEEPNEDVFGLTFVISDLDGNRLRVAPSDH